MKILCLHGDGMSGSLFAMQTANFRRLLGGDHEYVFIDAPLDTECAAGLKNISTGPYFKWVGHLRAAEIRMAHDYIQSVIDEEGPFDGVMGFSQGSALATSIILQHEIEHPDEPPPFTFAILFSCVLVVSPDENFAKEAYENGYKSNQEAILNGINGVSEQKSKGRRQENLSQNGEPQSIAELVTEFVEIVVGTVRAAVKQNTASETDVPKDASEGLEMFPRMYHPIIMTERVKLPTVHICGRNDQFAKQSSLARKLFDKETMKYIEHSGGHDVPKLPGEISSAVTAAKWVVNQSRLVPYSGYYINI